MLVLHFLPATCYIANVFFLENLARIWDPCCVWKQEVTPVAPSTVHHIPWGFPGEKANSTQESEVLLILLLCYFFKINYNFKILKQQKGLINISIYHLSDVKYHFLCGTTFYANWLFTSLPGHSLGIPWWKFYPGKFYPGIRGSCEITGNTFS